MCAKQTEASAIVGWDIAELKKLENNYSKLPAVYFRKIPRNQTGWPTLSKCFLSVK